MIEKINLQLINSLFETNEENSITLKSCLEEGDLLSEKQYCFSSKKFFHNLSPILSIFNKCSNLSKISFSK